ncbi:MAG: hypothetical protein KatS3mg095_0187 [Candidatus Parcubacteria bacterium]|nr:MAG: hypothetical protein KatS3mg095_0187 [Candidatus Parcubacteria bacterium]
MKIKYFKIFLILSLLIAGYALSQNRLTTLKTDNRGFKFYYNPTSTSGFERELIIGLSNYTNDCYGEDSCNNSGTFGLPLIESKPTGNYLNEINKNILRILNFNNKTNLIAIRLGLNSNTYSRILFDPGSQRIIFDSSRQNAYPIEGNYQLSKIYADISDLIAIYSCEEERVSCLGKTGVYKIGTQPPGAIFQEYLDNIYYRGAGKYLNPDTCFGGDPSISYSIHICLGDCGGNDEALTFCFRIK